MYNRSQNAEKWFNDLTQVHRMLAEVADTDNGDPVKIAILDTGVDNNHPLIQTQQHRIKGWADWTQNYEGKEGNARIDRSGHGTHSTWLLLQYAPGAEIYVSKVSTGEKTDPQFRSQVAKVGFLL